MPPSKVKKKSRILVCSLLLGASVLSGSHARAHASQAPAGQISATSDGSDGIALSSPLQVSASSVQRGGQITAMVTFVNQSTSAISLAGVDIVTRDSQGGNEDLGGAWNLTLAAGQSMALTRTGAIGLDAPTGVWTTEAGYQTTDGVWHLLPPQVPFTVTMASGPAATATNTPALSSNTSTLTNTPVLPTSTPTHTPVPPTSTSVLPTSTPTHTPEPPTSTPTSTPVPPSDASTPAAGSGIALSSPLQVSASSVQRGGQITATVTFVNQSSSAISLAGVDIVTRDSQGGNEDLGGAWNFTLAAGQSMALTKTGTIGLDAPTGVWTTEAGYQTTDGVWHLLPPQVPFTVTMASGPAATATNTPALSSNTSTLTNTPVLPTSTPTHTPVPPTSTSVLPTSTPSPLSVVGHQVALGAYIVNNGQYVEGNPGLIDWYANLVGRMPAIVNFGSSFGVPFNAADFDNIRNRGAMPQYTMAPDDSDANVLNGKYDSYLRTWAAAARAWGHPFLLRFAWEMNGNWYPWGYEGGNNGNSPAIYAAMWKHVHDIFTAAGATNVRWVWCVNNSPFSTDSFPGDAYVDYVGMDGYNYGTINGHAWESFDSVFSWAYNALTSLSTRPVIICEVGSVEAGGDKAAWISDMFARIPAAYPRIAGVIWFDAPYGSYPVQVNTSQAALAAFKAGDAEPQWQGAIS